MTKDPLEENYYALLLAIIYPCFLTADEALYAIRNGVSPLEVNEQTVREAFALSKMKKEPKYFSESYGRRYEMIKLISEFIKELNVSMKSLRDYELVNYRENVIHYMSYYRERLEKERIR